MRTEEVGGKDPNLWGLYDSHGNVWEWCHDWWDASDYTGDALDPWGDSGGTTCVERGGSWYNEPLHLRSALRGRGYQASGNSHLGFRLARSE
jgi:formylglycine-generating enzyme required for sulfatase activity